MREKKNHFYLKKKKKMLFDLLNIWLLKVKL